MKQLLSRLWMTIESSYLFRITKRFIQHLVGVRVSINRPLPTQTQVNNPQLPEKQNPLANYESYIIIAIHNSGKVDFLYEWKKPTEAAAKRCGELLYHLNEGHFSAEVMKHLLDFENKDTRKEFIHAILTAWRDKLQSIQPAVRPIAFFRHGKMNDQ